MRSVADALRRDGHAAIDTLSPPDRVELALRLGDEDAALLSAAAGISLADARRRLAAQRACGRRHSVANLADQC